MNRLRELVTALPGAKVQFPSISLTIPELHGVTRFLTSRMFLFNFMVGFLLMAIGIVGEDITLNRNHLETLQLEHGAIEQKLADWKSFIEKYKGYRDGYYQVALLENQLGNRQAAYEYGKLSVQIDPDFAAGKTFLQNFVR